MTADTSILRVVMVGHVDHGKSTIVGRLLYETNSLPDGKMEAVAAMSKRRGMPFEWAFVTDALQAERDQGITIDASHIRLRAAPVSGGRDYVLVDAPGHREFLRNMITGAATSDAALLVVDAAEGIRDQTQRHGFLLEFLGIRQLVVAVNKMDLVGFSEARFREIEQGLTAMLAARGIRGAQVVPVSAREGDMMAARAGNIPGHTPGQAENTGNRMPWYTGPTLLEAFARFTLPPGATDLPLRLPVQDVYKFDDRRLIAGTILSGRLRVGDQVLFSPENKIVTIRSIEDWPADPAHQPQEKQAGQAVAVTLSDQIFVERGSILSHPTAAPVETNVFRARLFWLGVAPLTAGARLTLQHLTAKLPCTVHSIDRVLDATTMEAIPADERTEVARDMIADVVIRTPRLIALDPYAENSQTGRFILTRDGVAVGGGLIDMTGYPNQRQALTVKASNIHAVEHRVTPPMRAQQNGHRGAVLWLTGLSGAGKSTIALEVERQLFRKGHQVYVLDADNVRTSLNADLGFTPEDRAENVRRLGAVAALFAEAGMIVLCAVISPYQADRDRARALANRVLVDGEASRFHEIHVKADLATCERRDPKGLYRKARSGEILNFTGISAPYEAPETPDLVLDTARLSVDEAVETVLIYVRDKLAVG